MIHINNVSIGTRLLPTSFSIKAGEVVHVIGPNGCGKSTLLSAVAGVIEHTGSVVMDKTKVSRGKAISDMSFDELALRRAYLSQSQKPTFNLHVFQYLALHIPEHCSPLKSEVSVCVAKVTALMNIEDKLHRSVHELSGGEWQRVRIAATALQVWPSLNPYGQLLILDEPAAPLDIGQQGLLYHFIEQMAEHGLAVIVANHDLNKTFNHADKVLMLKEGIKVGAGQPIDVMTAESLSELYGSSVRCVKIHEETVILT